MDNNKESNKLSTGSEIEALRKKIEADGQRKVNELLASPNAKITPDTFIEIINMGTKEFKKKAGRSMTYVEMRSIYG
jgi:hypothetical protein